MVRKIVGLRAFGARVRSASRAHCGVLPETHDLRHGRSHATGDSAGVIDDRTFVVVGRSLVELDVIEQRAYYYGLVGGVGIHRQHLRDVGTFVHATERLLVAAEEITQLLRHVGHIFLAVKPYYVLRQTTVRRAENGLLAHFLRTQYFAHAHIALRKSTHSHHGEHHHGQTSHSYSCFHIHKYFSFIRVLLPLPRLFNKNHAKVS